MAKTDLDGIVKAALREKVLERHRQELEDFEAQPVDGAGMLKRLVDELGAKPRRAKGSSGPKVKITKELYTEGLAAKSKGVAEYKAFLAKNGIKRLRKPK